MSTLRTNTLSNAAGSASVPVDTVISGSAKAWVNFNGTGTVAIRGSFNVSSITDNATSDYTINFTNALADTNYSASGICGYPTITTSDASRSVCPRTYATTSLRVMLTIGSGIVADQEFVNVAVFR